MKGLRTAACRITGAVRVLGTALLFLVVSALMTVMAAPALAADPTALEAQSRALSRASSAVLGVEVRALDDARSAATLGRERSGSGVVIGTDGLVLTIGWLVLEAESVDLVDDAGGRIPARVVAYDQATGFGLVQALAPLGRAPVPLGRSQDVSASEPLTMASGGEDGIVGPVRLIGRRAFSGSWEYHIEGALYTTPPRHDHGGAALINPHGELVGIGSLLLADAGVPGQPRTPGNLFVPVDLLAPILQELRERGRSQASARAWLGITCVEMDGELRVARVSDDSPAEVAGLEAGDRILRVDGARVGSLAELWQTLWAGGAPERKVTLEIQRDGRFQTLDVQAVDRATTLRHARGI